MGKAGAYLGKSRFRIIRSPQHQGGWIEIDRGGEAPLRTWVVYPEAGKQAPAVALIHGIRGLNDWTRAAALQVAASGYLGLAMRKLTDTQIHAAIDAVRRHALTISNGKTATIGFCWGGGESFRYAVNQPKLDAAIVFYGTSPETSTISRVDIRG